MHRQTFAPEATQAPDSTCREGGGGGGRQRLNFLTACTSCEGHTPHNSSASV